MSSTDNVVSQLRDDLIPKWRAQLDGLTRLIKAAEAFVALHQPDNALLSFLDSEAESSARRIPVVPGSLKGFGTAAAIEKVLSIGPTDGLTPRELAIALETGGQGTDFEKIRMNVVSSLKRGRSAGRLKKVAYGLWTLDERVRHEWRNVNDTVRVTDMVEYELTPPNASILGQRSESK